MNPSSPLVYILDLAAAVPLLWLIAWLFIGAVAARQVTLRIGWPFCWLGLAAVAYIVLRVAGVVA